MEFDHIGPDANRLTDHDGEHSSALPDLQSDEGQSLGELPDLFIHEPD